MKLFSSITVNPYFRGFNNHFKMHHANTQLADKPSNKWAYESGISTIVDFNNGLTASARVQYNSPRSRLQGLSFSDALYFVSLEKTFNNKYHVGDDQGRVHSRKDVYNLDKPIIEALKQWNPDTSLKQMN